ncbi:MAG: translocase [Deltaproteobacteria bacterium]|nr:translocase [Deltaproteobacteria bacterium]
MLSPLAKVEAHEGATALLLALTVFLLMSAYYTIKIAREALVLSESGAEGKVLAAAAQTLLMIPVVYFFGKLAERLDRVKLIATVKLFFVSNLLVFYLLYRAGFNIGIAFYIWVGVFNMTVFSQFWAFANDLYTREQGERLFPIVALGTASGAVAGSAAVRALRGVLGNSVEIWMVIASGIILLCLVLVWWIDRHQERQGAEDGVEKAPPIEGGGAFQMVVRNRYLLLMALMMVTLNWVNTTGEYLLDRLILAAAQTAYDPAGGVSEKAFTAGFVANFRAEFFLWVNVATMLLQAFVVSRIYRFFGVRFALVLVPFAAFASYFALSLAPLLAVARWTKMAENSLDYSLQNTTRQTLFLVTSRAEKYKAKVAIDTFFVRAGDLLAASLILVVFYLLQIKTLGTFLTTTLFLAVVWLVVAWLIGCEYRRRVADLG